ncbi:MAG: methyltransferase, partial [Oscillospiraceae bacterium]|nr:methyltransferase [Oscillospiraceae bacterium]
FPVSFKEGFKATLDRKPIWQIGSFEQRIFTPRVSPDNIARSFVFEARAMDPNDGGGKDMFGVEWEYIPVAGGSMVRPGHPFLDDANEWYDKVVWPDLDSWDWQGTAEANREYLSSQHFISCWILNGWYERLISFMEFENAIMAMFDEDQQDAVKDFFDKLSDFYIKMIDKYIEYFPEIDSFCIHDDWGSQKETFFSPALCAEMIVPYMKRVTDHIHASGRYCELHSCGQALKQVPNMIAAGWDFWCGQPMNDMKLIHQLYGDKIIIGATLGEFDPAGKPEEEQRELARKFAETFCSDPSRPTLLNFVDAMSIPDAFREELYIQSRKLYYRD